MRITLGDKTVGSLAMDSERTKIAIISIALERCSWRHSGSSITIRPSVRMLHPTIMYKNLFNLYNVYNMSFVLFGTVSQCCDATSIIDGII